MRAPRTAAAAPRQDAELGERTSQLAEASTRPGCAATTATPPDASGRTRPHRTRSATLSRAGEHDGDDSVDGATTTTRTTATDLATTTDRRRRWRQGDHLLHQVLNNQATDKQATESMSDTVLTRMDINETATREVIVQQASGALAFRGEGRGTTTQAPRRAFRQAKQLGRGDRATDEDDGRPCGRFATAPTTAAPTTTTRRYDNDASHVERLRLLEEHEQEAAGAARQAFIDKPWQSVAQNREALSRG